MVQQIKFANGGIYHILNRGVRKSEMFLQDADYLRWELLLDWYTKYSYPYSTYQNRIKQVKHFGGDLEKFRKSFAKKYSLDVSPVEILCYVEMPNHFHLVLKQVVDRGVSSFMHKLATAYAMYFNRIHNISGALFEANYKAVKVVSNWQLKQLGRYLHVNPLVGGLITKERLLEYPWSSFPIYIKNSKNSFLTQKHLLDLFADRNELYRFTFEPFEEQVVEELKGFTHDDDHGWYGEVKGCGRKGRNSKHKFRAQLR